MVFECVGVPGMIDGVLAAAPLHARIVVVGVCMGADTFRPALAVNKELDVRFVVGYTPLEFRDTLHALAAGKLAVSHIVTGHVGLGRRRGRVHGARRSGGTREDPHRPPAMTSTRLVQMPPVYPSGSSARSAGVSKPADHPPSPRTRTTRVSTARIRATNRLGQPHSHLP